MDIVTEPNKILHRKLKNIEAITPEVTQLIIDMKKAMIKAKGVGLAANQVGIDLQIFVIDEKLAVENNVPDVYINPEISEYSSDKGQMEEGCLSIPGYWVQISRSKKLHIKALDGQGNKVKFKAKGFLARVLQHEHDHLNGFLIKDRV